MARRDEDGRTVTLPARGRGRWIFGTGATLIVVGTVLALTLGSRFGTDPNYVASAVIDRAVPDLELPRLGEPGTLSTADLEGSITVFNFWASWCAACRAEHDDLRAGAAKYEPFGVRFVGVVFQDRASSARAFLDELGWGYEYVMDPDYQAAIAFGVRGVPETYFVDRDGVIVSRISGETNIYELSAILDGMIFGASSSGLDGSLVGS